MPRLPDVEAWAVFANLAESGSFAQTANSLGVSKATVSKAIMRLEARIGTSLLNRNSRRLSLTDIGRNAAANAARILMDSEVMEAEAMAQSAAPRGVVRMAAPTSFGITHLATILPDLMLVYPEVSIDLHLRDELVDLVGDGFDLMLRMGALPDSSLRARRVCQIRRLLVGAPAYFERRGCPIHPRDLAAHACLGYTCFSSLDRWRFTHTSGEETVIEPVGPLRASNEDVLKPALLEGIGVAVQPEFLMWEDLAAGRLHAVMTDWTMPLIPLHIVTPPGGYRPASVTAVIEFLTRRLPAIASNKPNNV